jgi:hypothetical protein
LGYSDADVQRLMASNVMTDQVRSTLAR